jgi:phosphoglycerol transferase
MIRESIPKPLPRTAPLVDVLAMLALALSAFALVAKNLFIDNAVVFHDEYLYKVWADATIDHAWMLQHGVAPPMPNRLFALVFRPAAHGGLNAYDIAQLINVGFWAMGCAATWTLVRRLRMTTTGHLSAFGLALVALPLSTYTKYFMPEAMYTGMFLVATLVLIDGGLRGSLVRMAAAGFVLAAMYYVKPHALFALVVFLLFALTLANRWRASGAVLGGFAVGFVILSKLIPRLSPPGPHDLGVYEGMLRGLSERLASYADGPFGLVLDLAHVAAPHVAMFCACFGVAAVFVVGQVFPRWRLIRDEVAVPAEHRAFARFLLIATPILIGIAVLFTVLAGESGRVHTRYYMFLFPLWVGFVAMLGRYKLRVNGAAIASVFVLGGAGWLWFRAPTYAPYLNLSHVSDGPEWGFVFAGAAFPVGLALLVVAGLWTAWRGYGGKALLIVLAFVSLEATVETASIQKSAFRNGATDGRDSVAVEQIIGPAAVRKLVVVGPQAGDVDKFLFFLRDTPLVDYRPDTTPVDDIEQRFPEADWLVTVTTAYPVSDRYRCQNVGAIRLCALPRPVHVR